MSTGRRYEDLEDEVVSLLQGQFFDCAPLPDNQSSYTQSLKKPVAYVTYDTSDYQDSESISMIVQKDRIRFGFDIRARNRRGADGIFAMFEIIHNKVHGLNLLGYDKIQYLSFSPIEDSEPNYWHYYIQFTTIANIADKQEAPDEDGNLLTDPEFVDP
jgi:hypothetical protein